MNLQQVSNNNKVLHEDAKLYAGTENLQNSSSLLAAHFHESRGVSPPFHQLEGVSQITQCIYWYLF